MAAHHVDGHRGVGQARVGALVAGLYNTLHTRSTGAVDMGLHTDSSSGRSKYYSLPASNDDIIVSNPKKD